MLILLTIASVHRCFAAVVDIDAEDTRRSLAILIELRDDDNADAICRATHTFNMHELTRKFFSGECEVIVRESKLDASRKNC
jgi:hypothetical protein